MAIALPSSKMFDCDSLVEGRLDIQVLAKRLMADWSVGKFIRITTEPEVSITTKLEISITTEPEVILKAWLVVVFIGITAKISGNDLWLFALLDDLLEVTAGDFGERGRR